MATNSNLERLSAAGIPVNQLPEGAQTALGELSSDEVDVMIRVRERLQAAGAEDDVSGHLMRSGMADTGVFYY
jgi:hypothetical protein